MQRLFQSLPLALVLAAAPAFAAEGHHAEFDWSTNGVYLIVFFAIMTPVVWFLIPLVRKTFIARRDTARADMDDADAAFQAADARLKATEARLANLQAEVEALVAEFQHLGEDERDALAREGEAVAAKVREETTFRLAQAVKVARAELTQDLVSRAFSLVVDRLAATATTPTSDAVIDRVVEGVSKG